MMRAIRRLWALVTRRAVEAELDEELRFHLEQETARHVAAGLTPAEAAAAARRDLGGFERTKDDVRDARGLDRVDGVLRDARYAVRALGRAPALVAVVTLTLALGIGATTAIFSVVHAVLLESLPFDDPGRLVVPRSTTRGTDRDWIVTLRDFQSWQQAGVFAHVGLYQVPELDLAADSGEPMRIRMAVVTADFFSTLGIRPLLGRLPVSDEFQRGSERPLVLSWRIWQRLGGGRDIIGRTVRITGTPVTVVGVLSRDAAWPADADAWYPNRSRIDPSMLGADNFIYYGIARLKPGQTLADARGRLDVLARRVEAEFPDKRKDVTVTAVPLRESLVGAPLTRALWILLGGVGCVLLIACANIANLQLARAAARQREMAMRIALGASRGRLMRQMIIESVVLSIPGGLLGIATAAAAMRALKAMVPANMPRVDHIGLDPVVLSVATGLTLFAAFLVGLAPALQAARTAPALALAEAGARGSTGVRVRRLASALVVSEVALSLTLLAGAGLLTHSLARLMRVETGLDADHVLTFEAALPQAAFHDRPSMLRYWNDLTSRLAAAPGIQAASIASALPLGGGGFYLGRTMIEDGAPQPPQGPEVNVMWNDIAPDFFRTMGQPLIEGRDFTARDDSASPPVIIVNQAFARAMFPGGHAVGERVFSWRDERLAREIVGVVGNVKYQDAAETPGPIIYIPLGQEVVRNGVVLLRTAGEAAGAAAEARRIMHALNPGIAMANVQTMPEVMSLSTARARITTQLLGVFAALALLLASIGLYGLLAYHVAQRRLEIGVRMALGAGRGDVVRLVLGRALRLAGAGTVIGLAGALVISRLMRALLFEVTPGDPLTFVAVTGLLLLVALAAGYLPALRATRIHPASALRSD